MSVLATKIQKGDRVQLRNGWFATILDNKKNSHTRLMEVEGNWTERGSVYTTDILRVRTTVIDGLMEKWEYVEFTPAQVKAASLRAAVGL